MPACLPSQHHCSRAQQPPGAGSQAPGARQGQLPPPLSTPLQGPVPTRPAPRTRPVPAPRSVASPRGPATRTRRRGDTKPRCSSNSPAPAAGSRMGLQPSPLPQQGRMELRAAPRPPLRSRGTAGGGPGPAPRQREGGWGRGRGPARPSTAQHSPARPFPGGPLPRLSGRRRRTQAGRCVTFTGGSPGAAVTLPGARPAAGPGVRGGHQDPLTGTPSP